MKWHIKLLLIFTISTLIVKLLIIKSHSLNDSKNGFERKHSISKPVLVGIFDFKEELQNLEFIPDSKLRISQIDPEYLIDLDLLNYSTLADSLNLPVELKVRAKNSFFIRTNNKNIYFFPLNMRKIYRISGLNNQVDTLRKSGPLYLKAIVPNEHNIIFQEFDEKDRDTRLTKWNIDSLRASKSISVDPRYHDGGMSTDGQIYYEQNTGVFAHIHFYYNEVQIIDTQLNLLKSFKTIDTISTPKLKTSIYGTMLTNSSPANILNSCAAIDEKCLYICSKLKADNDNRSEFNNNDVIDKYSLKNGAYLISYYIPRTAGEKIKNFVVRNNSIFCQTAHHIAIFKFF